MDRTARTAARSAWKNRPADAGIYAMHGPAGGLWVGASPTLGAIENRLRFTLRMGGAAPASLTGAWAQAGGEGFRFEVLERFDPELTPLERGMALKERLAHWLDRLGAEPL